MIRRWRRRRLLRKIRERRAAARLIGRADTDFNMLMQDIEAIRRR